jgi:hypothetical protein
MKLPRLLAGVMVAEDRFCGACGRNMPATWKNNVPKFNGLVHEGPISNPLVERQPVTPVGWGMSGRPPGVL